MPAAFLIGVAAGYAIAIPIGPIAILILRTGMRNGVRAAALAGAGTATADLVYASVAMLFGAAAGRVLEPFLPAARIAAVVVLAWIAIRTLTQAARLEDREIRGPTYLIFLMLTLMNPPTVWYFVSLSVGLPAISRDVASLAAFIGGVFLASLSWQTLLAVAGAILKDRLSSRVQRVTAVVSAVIILGLAARIAVG